MDDPKLLRFRCHVGHAYSGEAILAAQAQEAETMLWSLMRAHQERAELARRLASREREAGREALEAQLLQRSRDYDEDAEVVRRLIGNSHEAIDEAGEQGDL